MESFSPRSISLVGWNSTDGRVINSPHDAGKLPYRQPLPPEAAEAVAEAERELQYNLACSYTDAQMMASAAEIFNELWENWPKEHRFGVKLLSCQIALSQIPKARVTLDQLRWRQKTFAEEARALLKEIDEKGNGRELEAWTPQEQAEIRRLRILANVPRGSAKQVEAALLLAEGRRQEANDILEAMRRIGHASPEFHLRMAQVHQMLKRPDDAENAYREALKLDPNDANAHLGLAQVHLSRRQNYAAAGFARSATSLLYHYPAAHFALGVALHRQGLLDRAVMAFQVCLSQNPNVPAAHRRLAFIYQNHLRDSARAGEHRRRLQELVTQARKIRRAPLRDKTEGESIAIAAGREAKISRSVAVFNPDTLASPRSDTGFMTIVTGLPRSGTSLMMQMLASGGLPALYDDHRPPDEDNPRGYFEFAPAKDLRADCSWLPHAQGRALKLVAPLLPFLPPGHDYRLIFVERSLDEVLSSQRVMLARLARKGAELDPQRLKTAYVRQLNLVMETIERLKLPVLRVAYSGALANPRTAAYQVADFLSLPLDVAAMTAVVDPALYRQRHRPLVRYRHE